MSSLLLSATLGNCQTSLRDRRRSSLNAFNQVPHLFSTAHVSSQEGSALVDEDEVSEEILSSSFGALPTIPYLSTPADAQLPDHASKITIPRHFNKPPAIDTTILITSSPSSSSPPTAVDIQKASYFPDGEEPIPNTVNMERLRWRLASGFFAYFLCGWGDGVTGTVLPHFMAEFNISFTMSSLLYAGGTIGFFFGTLAVESIINYLGQFDVAKTSRAYIPKIGILGAFFPRRHLPSQTSYSPTQARFITLLVAGVLHGMFFVMMGSRGGFWVLFWAYALAAFARAILTATLNEYFAVGYQQSLGYAFGCWSLGGVASPMVCQAVLSMGVPWSQFYFGSLVLSGLNVVFLVATFRPTQREFHQDRDDALLIMTKKTTSADASPVCEARPSAPKEQIAARKPNMLRVALRLPYLWTLALFSLLYCGCETATQSFMVSYLLGVRNADPRSAGYVTSGFWGGITVGRLVWGHYTPKLSCKQRKWVIEACIVVGLIMEILIWTVNSNVQNALATSIIGLVFGPVYPANLTLAQDILPAEVLMVSMAIISAAASLGSALFPFIAGVISSARGVHTLTYITVPLACSVAILWMLFPAKNSAKRVVV